MDVLAGDVPCQPWSIAGKGQDIEEKIGGERDLRPEMFRVTHQVRPQGRHCRKRGGANTPII
ncbi:DNA cytosine methyltransferase [Plantactinospora sonchi]|uniref:DNA cytosine methyltransferase n=1 Tax=Plantactinospora sonchi TaxID=1544735 RepID=UPI0038B5A2DA